MNILPFLTLMCTCLVYCVCVKRITLCSYLCSSSSSSSTSRSSASCVRYFGIVNLYSWFWKSLNLADWGAEFSFFQGIHVRTEIRFDISISIRPVTTKFCKQVHLGELAQMRLINRYLWCHHVKIMWQKNPCISPLPQCLCMKRRCGQKYFVGSYFPVISNDEY